MRSRIRNTMIILCFALILSFVSCNNTRVDEKKQIYIGVTCYDQKDTFIGELIETFKKECASLDTDKYDISMTIMDAAGSQRAQDDQVQEMIEDGCNVLCINLVDRTDLSHIINAAMEKDIPIIFFNREPVDEDLNRWDKLYYVGAKAKQSGQMQGELIADYIKNNPGVDKNGDGRIQYVILEGEMGHQDAIVRTESVTESMKNNGLQIEKLSCQIANWNRAQAQNRMTQLIGQYKNSIELVIANNDAMALGAIDAYEKLGVTESNVPAFFGVDGTDDGLEAVQQSKLAATVYNDKEGQARAMASLAYLAATGGSMKSIKFEDKKYVYLPYEKVTLDNVNEFVKDEQ